MCRFIIFEWVVHSFCLSFSTRCITLLDLNPYFYQKVQSEDLIPAEYKRFRQQAEELRRTYMQRLADEEAAKAEEIRRKAAEARKKMAEAQKG